MRTICVDVDSTLCNHWERIARFSENGVIQPEAFVPWNVMADEPLPGAIQALGDFVAVTGATILILTARDWDMPDGDTTRKWLDKCGFWYDGVLTVRSSMDKPEVLKKVSADLLIDDFMGGQELRYPKFDVNTYLACFQTVIAVEVFRNNWPEIVDRWLRNWGYDEAG